MKTNYITVSIFALLFSIYCVQAQNTLQFEKKEIQFGEKYDTTKSTVYVELQFTIPVVQSDTSSQKIRTQILSAIFETPTDSVITDSATLGRIFFGEGDLLESDWRVNREKVTTGRVLFTNTGIVSYGIDSYMYSGGAHGYSSVQYFVFDIKTGKHLTEDDIFTGNYQEVITRIMLKELSKEDSLEEFYKDKIRPNGNFKIDETGITYFFNPYEIASYAKGSFEVFISRDSEALHDILKKDLFVD
ncbi:MAG: DUF3298 and DUF4163 domain-containing protein [Bacteroidales bacterium]|jgi:hypothetical protein|nr:DUF3298 and DUF4163 domain-containing protein [Bacteroidales bacterium]